MGLPSHGHLTSPGSGVFRSGDVLDGRYRIEHVIAEGGVAVVVAAEQLGLDRHVAIKLLRPECLADRHLVEHFKSEGALAAKIKSEHVVKIHDVGEWPGVGPYMVMELLEGHDLEHRLVAGGPLPMEDAVDYVLQACDALVEAHHLRIVHRDLKPANLFLAQRPPRPPIVKIIDFGISKIVPRTFDGSDVESLAGTPAYMSPELIQAKAIDARADIWALGVVLFELVTGQLPFPLDAPLLMLEKICTTAPIPLRALRPDLPPALEAIILKCLARDVDRRYASVAELAEALAPFRGVRDVMKSSGEIEVAHAYTDPRRLAPTMVVQPKKARPTMLYAALGLTALALTGTGLIVAARAARKPPTLETSTAPPPAATTSAAPPVETSNASPSSSEAAPPSSATSVASTAKGRPVAPAKTKPSQSPQKPGGATHNDRSMFGERK